VAFSPDGKRIVSGRWEKNTLKVWDTNTGQEILKLKGHTDPVGGDIIVVHSVAFSPDGKKIVSGCNDKTLKVWDANTGQEIFTLSGHTDGVRSVNFSPDSKRIVSGSDDSTLKVWDANTGQEIRTVNGHKEPVSSVAFSPDGKKMASIDTEKKIKIWEASTGKEIFSFDFKIAADKRDIHHLYFSKNGKSVLVKSTGGGISDFDLETGKELPTSMFTNYNYLVSSNLQTTPDKQWTVGIKDGAIILINNNLRKEQITRDIENLAQWAKPSSKWHADNADNSEMENQWFAAAFHLRKFIELNPSNEEFKRRLQVAEEKLKQVE
jgi:WD40 repeat protein